MSSFSNIEVVDNLASFFNLIAQKKSIEPIWFRGQKDSTWKLRPSLYRRILEIFHRSSTTCNPTEFYELLVEKENIIFEEFKVRNYHLIKNNLPDKRLIWLSLMQHNELPTRLLDWTEQALPSMFFALSDFFNSPDYVGKKVPCVWILDPIQLNKNSESIYNEMVKEKQITFHKENLFNLFELDQTKDKDPSNLVPLPVLAPHINDRIHAQSGVFVTFPWKSDLLDKYSISPEDFLLSTFKSSNSYLTKVLLTSPRRICNELKEIGLKTSVIYPEMASSSKEIDEQFLRKY